MNRLLSLDLSTKKTGFCVADEDGNLLQYGCIESKLTDWRERVKFMQQEITKLITDFNIDLILIEDIPMSSVNVKTTIQLSTIQGVIMALTTIYNIPLQLAQPTAWRSKIGLFDGTAKGKTRIEMKKKGIIYANEKYGLSLQWVSDSSSKNDDDIGDSLCLMTSYFITDKPITPKPIKPTAIKTGFGKRV